MRASRASAPAHSNRLRHSASNVHAGERTFSLAQSGPGRQALVCGTPYQLKGAVALLLQGATCQPEMCDLYLRHGFANAAAISRRLRDEHLARTVVDVAPGKGASLDLRGSEASVAMDESARAQVTGRHVPDAPHVRILCSYPFDTVKALLQASPDAELVLFDDGLGSYGGDILRENGGARGCRDPPRST